MLPAPRVVVIDDDPAHLEGLTQGLNQYGTACLPVHYTGEAETISPCPSVRVVFADLHLSGGPPADHAQDFSTIGGLLEGTIKPSGPYLIVLWTMYPDQAGGLLTFLKDRLQEVPKPFAVFALDKNDHLDPKGAVKDPKSLVDAIKRLVSKQPEMGALLNWEERVLEAAADTVSSIMALAGSAEGNSGKEAGRLLACLALAALGEKHARENLFRAVNEGLLPILGDRIASLRSREKDNELWETVLVQVEAERKLKLSRDEAARLNQLLHIAPSDGDGSERGAVILLPDEFFGEAFTETFELLAEEGAKGQFWCRKPKQGSDLPQWVLVQTQAACDYAQNQPGPIPFHLGLCLSASDAKKGTPPAALWRSPCFVHGGEACFLHVNARFQLSLPARKAESEQLLFRLREQLLNDLIYQIHGYGARPGIVSVRESK